MSFKFTFREITPEDTEILRMLKLRNAKPEEHICCEILRGDGITMKTWYSKADVALWGEDYIKANSKMKYIDGLGRGLHQGQFQNEIYRRRLDGQFRYGAVEPHTRRIFERSHIPALSPLSYLAHWPCEGVGTETPAHRDIVFYHRQ